MGLRQRQVNSLMQDEGFRQNSDCQGQAESSPSTLAFY